MNMSLSHSLNGAREGEKPILVFRSTIVSTSTDTYIQLITQQGAQIISQEACLCCVDKFTSMEKHIFAKKAISVTPYCFIVIFSRQTNLGYPLKYVETITWSVSPLLGG